MSQQLPRKFDRIDLTILDVLQRNGRISNAELAKRVNLSASPCLERVRRLEKEGVIEHYGAYLNARALNYGMSAFVQVTLDRTTADVFDRFREGVVKIKYVTECNLVAGGFDYLIKIVFSDMDSYRDTLASIVDLPAVAQTHTYIVTDHIIRDTGFPIF
ncbi:winged helix-turn-helix transcriptional regulator [Thalassotalea ganghwensis]